MDLIGIPLRIVVSGKTLESGEVELKHRTEGEAQRVSREAIVDTIMESEWLRS